MGCQGIRVFYHQVLDMTLHCQIHPRVQLGSLLGYATSVWVVKVAMTSTGSWMRWFTVKFTRLATGIIHTDMSHPLVLTVAETSTGSWMGVIHRQIHQDLIIWSSIEMPHLRGLLRYLGYLQGLGCGNSPSNSQPGLAPRIIHWETPHPWPSKSSRLPVGLAAVSHHQVFP